MWKTTLYLLRKAINDITYIYHHYIIVEFYTSPRWVQDSKLGLMRCK